MVLLVHFKKKGGKKAAFVLVCISSGVFYIQKILATY